MANVDGPDYDEFTGYVPVEDVSVPMPRYTTGYCSDTKAGERQLKQYPGTRVLLKKNDRSGYTHLGKVDSQGDVYDTVIVNGHAQSEADHGSSRAKRRLNCWVVLTALVVIVAIMAIIATCLGAASLVDSGSAKGCECQGLQDEVDGLRNTVRELANNVSQLQLFHTNNTNT